MENSPVYVVLDDLKNVLQSELVKMESDCNSCVLKKETFKMGIEKIHFLQSLLTKNQL